MLALLNTSERHSMISGAVRRLWSVHLALNNFYNEPPFAERLMTLSEMEPIPETIQEQFVHTVVGCYIGNGYGVSNAAVQFYETMIRSFSPKEIVIMIAANKANRTIADRSRSRPSCRRRFVEALRLVEAASIKGSARALYRRLIRTLRE